MSTLTQQKVEKHQERIDIAQSNYDVEVFKFKFHDTTSINADMGNITLAIYKDKSIVGEMDITALLGMPQYGTLYLNGKYSVKGDKNIVKLKGKGFFTSFSYGTKAYEQDIEMIMESDWSKGTIPSLGTNEVVIKVS